MEIEFAVVGFLFTKGLRGWETSPSSSQGGEHELARANMNYKIASPSPLLSSFRSLNEQRPTVPKEGSTSLERLLRKQNEFVYKLITLIYSKIFSDILGCRLRRGEPKPQGGRLLMETSPNPSQGGEHELGASS